MKGQGTKGCIDAIDLNRKSSRGSARRPSISAETALDAMSLEFETATSFGAYRAFALHRANCRARSVPRASCVKAEWDARKVFLTNPLLSGGE